MDNDAPADSRRHIYLTAAIFVLLTLILTWPLPSRLQSSYPGDLGDPLFISWVMGWVSHQITAALTNPLGLRTFWDAGIFYPERGALTFSEHFVPQTLMVLPIYWATHSLILCYNVAFLMSYVLTGIGTALLTRALTRSLMAGLVAGVIASFNEYRLVWEVAHLQTLSVYWLPFVLLGIHRYLVTGRRRPLVWTVLSWVGLNLSSVYYMAYCAPFIAVFALIELIRLGQWRHVGRWRDLAIATAAVGFLTLPFVIPYALTQRRLGFERTLQEVIAHSATLDAYRAALPRLVVPLTLGALALVVAFARLVITKPPSRVSNTRALFSPSAAFIMAALSALAVWLSLGPVVQSGGHAIDVPALYPVLAHLPGYSGLRVPARFASLFLIFLGVLAGLGVAACSRRMPRTGGLLAVVAIGVFLWQGREQRIPLDQPLPSPALAAAPAYLKPSATLPPIYRAVAHLPSSAVIIEWPIGDPWYDVRYLYFAAMHERRLINGYSGVFPPSYHARIAAVGRPWRDTARARAALADATHAIVHKAAWTDGTGNDIAAWLEQQGARSTGEVDGAVLYELPRFGTE
jgi:hypothetical protein